MCQIQEIVAELWGEVRGREEEVASSQQAKKESLYRGLRNTDCVSLVLFFIFFKYGYHSYVPPLRHACGSCALSEPVSICPKQRSCMRMRKKLDICCFPSVSKYRYKGWMNGISFLPLFEKCSINDDGGSSNDIFISSGFWSVQCYWIRPQASSVTQPPQSVKYWRVHNTTCIGIFWRMFGFIF